MRPSGAPVPVVCPIGLAVVLHLTGRELAEGLRDRPLAFIAGVQVGQSRTGGGVAHPVQQPGTRARGEHVPGVAQVVRVDCREPGGLESREPARSAWAATTEIERVRPTCDSTR